MIDIDVAPSDRDKVYQYIINRFGADKTAFILAIGTIKAKGCIDEICRALALRWYNEHKKDDKEYRMLLAQLKDKNVSVNFGDSRDGFSLMFSSTDNSSTDDLIKKLTKEYYEIRKENEKLDEKNPWKGKIVTDIKDELGHVLDLAKDAGSPGTKKYKDFLLSLDEYKKLAAKYPEVFYYFDGLLDVAISQSMHPAGIVASPVTLADNYGTFYSDGKIILQIDMECVHEVNLVKYDILGLKNVEIIKDAYNLIGSPYPKSHEINWFDEAVWKDMLRSPVGIFQFEGERNCPR